MVQAKVQNTAKKNQGFLCGAYAAGLWLGFVLVLPAHALDAPFDFDVGNWTSYDNYGTSAPSPPSPAEQGKIFLPVFADPPVQEKAQVPPSPEPPAPSVTLFLAPAMPGLDKGFDLKIDSTGKESEKQLEKLRPAAKADMASGFRIPDKNWESPSVVKKAAHDEDAEGEEALPLNVRMTFLPTQNIDPVPSPEHESARKLGHELHRKKLAEKRQKQTDQPPEVAAACAAMDLYKKQQLDALQSDRETLLALQNAIHSLGFTKQLGHVAGEETPPGGQTPAPPAQ